MSNIYEFLEFGIYKENPFDFTQEVDFDLVLPKIEKEKMDKILFTT